MKSERNVRESERIFAKAVTPYPTPTTATTTTTTTTTSTLMNEKLLWTVTYARKGIHKILNTDVLLIARLQVRLSELCPLCNTSGNYQAAAIPEDCTRLEKGKLLWILQHVPLRSRWLTSDIPHKKLNILLLLYTYVYILWNGCELCDVPKYLIGFCDALCCVHRRYRYIHRYTAFIKII